MNRRKQVSLAVPQFTSLRIQRKAIADAKPVEAPRPKPAEPKKEKEHEPKKIEVVQSKRRPKKQLTEEELEQKTKDFMLVKDLETVKTGTYIRYVGSDGVYHQGGFVWCNRDGKIGIGTTMGFNSRFKWMVKYTSIKRLYVRLQAESMVLAHEMDELIKTTTVLFAYLKKRDGKTFVDYVKENVDG